jgi:pyrroline-5-carboxylate reductase
MDINDPRKYIQELALQNSRESFISENERELIARDLTTTELATKTDVEQSFMNDKSLVSFVSEVSEQRRQDVLHSVLLAQLAANKKFPEEDQIKEWYEEFVKVLSNIGWAMQSASFTPFTSQGTTIEVDKAIIDLVASAVGGSALVPIISKTLDAIKGLSASSGKFIAFEKNTHTATKGAFQIGVAKEVNNTVALQLGTFLITSSDTIKQILFFKSSKTTTTLEFCSRVGTLDEATYSTIREAVQNKLGFKATDFIADIDLGD